MLTQAQIQFAVTFWVDRLSKAKTRNRSSVPDEKIIRFSKALAKILKGPHKEHIPDLRALCCQYGPQATLRLALRDADLDTEPPVLLDDIDMVFNPDGSVDVRNPTWKNYTP